MTTHMREELFRVLGELSRSCPEVRFGQLMANLSYMAKGPTNESIWDVEDQQLLKAARKQLAERRKAASAA